VAKGPAFALVPSSVLCDESDVQSIMLGELERAMICPRCQSKEMQRRWTFRHRTWLVVTGAVALCFSLAIAAAGLSGLAHGLANVGHREGPDFSVFGGSVLLVVSLVGLVISGLVLRGRRVWRCETCGVAAEKP
jgi:hypothetical protein